MSTPRVASDVEVNDGEAGFNFGTLRALFSRLRRVETIIVFVHEPRGLSRRGPARLRNGCVGALGGANLQRTSFGIISGLFAPVRDLWRCFVLLSSSVPIPSSHDYYRKPWGKLVGAGRFELPTPGPPDRCANRAALRSDVGNQAFRHGLGKHKSGIAARLPPALSFQHPLYRIRGGGVRAFHQMTVNNVGGRYVTPLRGDYRDLPFAR